MSETRSKRKGWLYAALAGCLFWAFMIVTPALDGAQTNYARGNAQVAILAAPLWLVIVEPLWDLLGPVYRDLTRTRP